MADEDNPPDGTVAVVRRAPFSDNPRVGARGQRTQQRILDAALVAFGEKGFHGCSIDRITTLARCSRVSFYQYFANKEDVFRQLAGQIARQVSASTEALTSVTPDQAGWTALRGWVARYAEIHTRYEPVFHALETDEMLMSVARYTGEETVTRIRARLEETTLPPRSVDPTIRLLLECANHALDISGLLRSVAPGNYDHERVEIAITDVVHRTLFGRDNTVNIHDAGESPSRLDIGSEMMALIRSDGNDGAENNRALAALLTSGRDVFTSRGYHSTRVDDLVDAAGVSHGAFYRYFDNKEALARTLTAQAVQAVGATVLVFPDLTAISTSDGKPALRRWLTRYNAAHASEAGMMRVWIDAALQDPELRTETAPLLDWGRRRMARVLAPRDFGDVEIEAVVMVALLEVFGARKRPGAEVDAAVHIIERGLLGR
jgi:AcrR family transcriptional regulator